MNNIFKRAISCREEILENRLKKRILELLVYTFQNLSDLDQKQTNQCLICKKEGKKATIFLYLQSGNQLNLMVQFIYNQTS